MSNTWNLDDGLKLVRALQPETRRYGYHLALGGSVLNNGISRKDIDLYFLPMDSKQLAPLGPNTEALIKWLVKLWGNYENIGKNYDDDEVQSLTLNSSPFVIHDSVGVINRPIPITPSEYYGVPGNTIRLPISETIDTVRLPDHVLDSLFNEPAAPLKPMNNGGYKYKLKFNRNNSGDRIDAFII